MKSWLFYFREGFSKGPLKDPIVEDETSSGFKNNIKNLIPFFKKYWKKGLIGFFLILGTTFFAFPLPIIHKHIIDDVIIGKQLSLLAKLAIVYVVIKMFGKISSSFLGFYFARFEQTIILDIQTKLLEHTLKLPKSFFDKKEIGYLMSRISNDVMGLRFFFSSTLLNVMTSGIQFIGGFIFLFYLKWQLSLLVFIFVPFLVLLVKIFSKKTFNLSSHHMEQNANVSKTMQESLTLSPLIKAYNSEQSTLSKISKQLKKSLNINLQSASLNTAANFSINLLPEIFRFIVLISGAIMIVKGNWTIGALLAFQSYTSFVYGPALFLANVNLSLQGALVSLKRVSGLFDIVPEENLQNGKKLSEPLSKIEFDQVSFAYDPNVNVLSELNFKLIKGKAYSIIGESGVGKTTLVSLILSFYKPVNGSILFNEHNISELNLSHLRKKIGYLNQTPFIISGTVSDNILYGSKDLDLNNLHKAAKIAGIHDFIMKLPNQYQEELKEKGSNLSQGQKQRIALARVIYKNPDIIILDEPTSALDIKTSDQILDTLSGYIKDKIFIVITHNQKSIKKTDYSLILNKNGTVREIKSDILLTNNNYREFLDKTNNDQNKNSNSK